jgi:H+/Cl- antiporter ClcA
VALGAGLGYAAVFGSATNTFFAPIFIGAEVFGFNLVPLLTVVMATAYFVNFNKSIYGGQLLPED